MINQIINKQIKIIRLIRQIQIILTKWLIYLRDHFIKLKLMKLIKKLFQKVIMKIKLNNRFLFVIKIKKILYKIQKNSQYLNKVENLIVKVYL